MDAPETPYPADWVTKIAMRADTLAAAAFWDDRTEVFEVEGKEYLGHRYKHFMEGPLRSASWDVQEQSHRIIVPDAEMSDILKVRFANHRDIYRFVWKTVTPAYRRQQWVYWVLRDIARACRGFERHRCAVCRKPKHLFDTSWTEDWRTMIECSLKCSRVARARELRDKRRAKCLREARKMQQAIVAWGRNPTESALNRLRRVASETAGITNDSSVRSSPTSSEAQ